MRQSGEIAVVRRAIAGDSAAFAELVGRYRDAVYGVCYHHTGHAEEAKDLAQEAFVRAYLSLPQLRDPAAFPAWLRRVTERVCATWRRRQRLQVVPLEGAPEPRAQPELDLPLAVRHALAQLADDVRLAVTLYYVNGYSTREVAQFLGIPAGTVKSRLYHARRRLKEELMDEYRGVVRKGAPGPEFEGAVVRAVRSLEEMGKLPLAQKYGGAKTADELGLYFVLEKDGSVLGECFFSPGAIPIRGAMVKVAYDSYMSGEGGTILYWQREGMEVMDQLVPHALAQAAESGLGVAAWHGELVPASRYGFVPCFYHHRITAAARDLVRGQVSGAVRPCSESDSEAVARLRAMPRSRPDMWAWQGPRDLPNFVVERDGQVVGCYSLARKHAKHADSASLLNEMEGVDMAAYHALAVHWGQKALEQGVETVTTYLSPAHPIGRYMLTRGGVCQTQGASWNVAVDEELLCILDLATALRAVAPGLGRPAKGRVTINMDGEVATIIAGDPARIEEGARVGVEPSRIGRVPMTHVLVGYCSLFEIAGRSDVAIRDEDYALLDALFPATRPYAWPDPYIWDEGCLREDRPWAYEEPWLSRLASHPRPWA